MAQSGIVDPLIWEQFKEEASKRHQNAVDLVTDYIKECLEIWEDEALDEEIGNYARQSGYTEDDGVELVRQYRRENRD
jgi:hypothetical protein